MGNAVVADSIETPIRRIVRRRSPISQLHSSPTGETITPKEVSTTKTNTKTKAVADICVLYGSADKSQVARLVDLLKQRWTVWWSDDIDHGSWEAAARQAIDKARVVLPILSCNDEIKDGFLGELAFASSKRRPILPFQIAEGALPLQVHHLSRIDAIGWSGDQTHASCKLLMSRLSKVLGVGARPQLMTVGRKQFPLPGFVFSLSSHETQIAPADGLTLLQLLEPAAVLVSAYDVSRGIHPSTGASLGKRARAIHDSDTVLFLDSGNYEAQRKGDLFSKSRNPAGWSRSSYRGVVNRMSADVTLTFDRLHRHAPVAELAATIAREARLDQRAASPEGGPVCPIVHVPPPRNKGSVATAAAKLVARVAEALDPLIIAIPERELGDGLVNRTLAVAAIRRELNKLDRYYPLHLLGTGNPLSLNAFAVAGADSFDGLEWCRTVSDYDRGFLFHFQQMDFFAEINRSRVRDDRVRQIMHNKKASYTVKALAYNVDFFNDWMRTLSNLIHSGQGETALKMLPNIGNSLLQRLNDDPVLVR